ncbi:MAG: hypothetical protein Q7U59_12910 [Lutibacter sp.]|nr:hypothetical protein [Lutibacter sp.]
MRTNISLINKHQHSSEEFNESIAKKFESGQLSAKQQATFVSDF